MFPVANEDLFSKVLNEYKSEYLKSMQEPLSDSSQVLIGYPDLTVWYYNRDCQSALSEIKKIWDSVQGTKFGTKSLNHFFSALTQNLFINHHQLTQCIKFSKEIKRLFESTGEVISALNTTISQPKDQEQEFFTFQTSISFPKPQEIAPSSLYLVLNLNFAEIPDLGSAFCEGFAGFSLEIQTKSGKFETNPVDVNGNQAIWMSEFQFRLSRKDKTVQIFLLENHITGQRKVAKFDLDVFQYLTGPSGFERIRCEEGQFCVGGKEKYAVMDVVDEAVEDAPKIGFVVSVLSNSLDGFKEWMEGRMKYLKGVMEGGRREIDGINIKLAQYTAGFKKVAFDEKRIFIVSERDEGFCCFSPAGEKKKRGCLSF